MAKLFVIAGPSGVGKGTLFKIVKEKYKENNEKLYFSISCTTRDPRPGEENGVHYYFITMDEFQKKIEEGNFLEYNKYGTGKYYGTPKDKVVEYLNNGYDVVLEIDPNGYKIVRENYPDCIGIFVSPPSIEELEARLINRGTETMDVIKQRMDTAREEMKTIELFDHNIVNTTGEETINGEKLYNIMRSYSK